MEESGSESEEVAEIEELSSPPRASCAIVDGVEFYESDVPRKHYFA